jgi:hypothetical protein
MFYDVLSKIRVFKLRNKRPDHHDENKKAKASVDDEPNWPSADEGGRFFQIGWGGVHGFMGNHGDVLHVAGHRSNANYRESSSERLFVPI